MTKETLKSRVENATNKIEKCQSIILKCEAFIEKKKAAVEKMTNEDEIYWARCDIESREQQIKDNQKKIVEAQKSLEVYKQQLADVEAFAEIPIFREFINQWKVKAAKWMFDRTREAERVYRENQEFQKTAVDACQNKYVVNPDGSFKMEDYKDYDWDGHVVIKQKKIKTEEYKKLLGDLNNRKVDYKEKYGGVLCYTFSYSEAGLIEKIAKDIEAEAQRKYVDLVNRVLRVGKGIIDCQYLHIGNNGDINGYVICENGKVKVETIGAGGYNIQCFHYRCLVDLIKEKKGGK